jgi:hypothetical protein
LQGDVGFAATLNPGDVSIIGFRSAANDGFSMATWVPLPDGTGIVFTDKAFDGGALLPNENAMTWVNNSGATIPAGTVINFGGPELGNGSGSSMGSVISGELNGLSQSGDNIFAIQGGVPQPHWIYGLSYLSPWLSNGAVSNGTSYLPEALNIPLAHNVLMQLNAEYDYSRNAQNNFAAYKNLVHDTTLWRSDDNGNTFGNLNDMAFTLAGAGTCTANGGILSALGSRSFCVGTGNASSIAVTATGAVGTNQRWGLINQEGDIVAVRVINSLFNLDPFPPGNYTIRYIRFENNTNIAAMSNVSDLTNLQGCYGVSSNAISLFLRAQPDAGVLSATSPSTVCKGQGPQTGIQVSLSGSSAENNVFALLSQSLGNQLIAAQISPVFNLNPYPPGQYFIANLGYQQGVNLQEVQFANQLQGCFDLSNSVSVSLVNCLGSQLESAPSPTTGISFVSFSNPQPGRATLEVYDMQGRLVQKLFDEVANAEQLYTLEFNGDALPNGVYMYRLTTENEVVVSKFMVAH